MLKHRNYITTSAFFLLIFLLFQVVVLDAGVDIAMTTNKVDRLELAPPVFPTAGDTTEQQTDGIGGALAASPDPYNVFFNMQTERPVFAIIAGAEEASVQAAKDISTILNYQRYPNRIYTSFEDAYSQAVYTEAESENKIHNQSLKAMIITTPNIDALGSVDTLLKYLDESGNVIFGCLPSSSSASYKRLEPIIGIIKNYGEYTQKGFSIYDGIFLSGVYNADEMVIQTSRIELYGKCRVYAVAKEEGKDNEEKNPLIWRTYYGRKPQSTGCGIFVVNAPFIMDKRGVGVLTGLISQMDDSFIYPIINSKAVVLEAFPFISDRNADTLRGLYNRGMREFVRDIMWSDLTSIKWESGLLYSSYIGGNITEESLYPDKKLLEFITKESVRNKSEMGFTIPESVGTANASMITQNVDYLRKTLPQYELYSYMEQSPGEYKNNQQAISQAFPKLSTVVTDWSYSNLGYMNETVVGIPVISEGYYYDEQQSWKLVNMASALGLIVHSLDLEEPIMRETDDDDWRNLSIEAAKNLSYMINKIKWISPNKITDLGIKFRNFANTRAKYTFEEYKITINIENFNEEAKFIFRTKKNVVSYRNCKIQEIGEGMYLVDADAANVTIDIQYAH